MRRARATLAVALVAFAILPTAPTQAQSGPAVISDAVTWKVDHRAKTITATVRLAFHSRGCVRSAASCPGVSPETAQKIVEAIKAYWNGWHYKCYRVVFDIQTRIVEKQSDAMAGEVDVAIDDSPTNVRDQNVAAVGGSDAASDDPADRVEPVRDPINPTTWASHGRPGGWAHEFGHVVGLHDNYDPQNPAVPVNGQEDLMHTSLNSVSQGMIDQVIKRSGQIKDSELECDYRVDYRAASGWTLKGKKCERPEGEWNLTMGGSGFGVSWRGKMSFTLDAPSLSGQIGGSWHGDIGGGATTDGTWSGTARFVDGDAPTIVIPGQSPGKVCVPGVGCRQGTSFGEATLVLEVGSFC